MTKTVALADEVYEDLARLKKPGQSFSDVVRDLTQKHRPRLREVSGSLQEDEEYWEAFARARREARRQSAQRVDLEDE